MDPDAESLHQIDWIQMMEIQNTVQYCTVQYSTRVSCQPKFKSLVSTTQLQ